MTEIPRWHFAMLNDAARNLAFEQAILARMRVGDRVVDIGAGTGLLSLLALRAGAEHVEAFEGHPEVADVAQKVLTQHHAGNRITLHRQLSTACTLPSDRRGDLLVTEIFDCGLIGEGIIPSLRAARRTLLRPSYRAVPRRVHLIGALVSVPVARRLNEVSEACGVDVTALNAHQTRGHFPIRLRTWEHTMLSDERSIMSIDLEQEPATGQPWMRTFRVGQGGVVDGVTAWFDMDLGVGSALTTRPGIPSHWMQAMLCFPEPVSVEEGQALPVTFAIEDDTRLIAQPTGVKHATDRTVDQLVIV